MDYGDVGKKMLLYLLGFVVVGRYMVERGFIEEGGVREVGVELHLK